MLVYFLICLIVIYKMIVEIKSKKLSPWVTLNTKLIKRDNNKPEVYHSFSQLDYVSLLAVRQDKLIPLVKQFRPAVEQITIELPGGLVDQNLSPLLIAKNELHEETGHKIIGNTEFLGCLRPDIGRLENTLWTYFAEVSSDITVDWKPEQGIEVILVSKEELREMIFNGSFNHALHIALIGLAITKGFFSW